MANLLVSFPDLTNKTLCDGIIAQENWWMRKPETSTEANSLWDKIKLVFKSLINANTENRPTITLSDKFSLSITQGIIDFISNSLQISKDDSMGSLALKLLPISFVNIMTLPISLVESVARLALRIVAIPFQLSGHLSETNNRPLYIIAKHSYRYAIRSTISNIIVPPLLIGFVIPFFGCLSCLFKCLGIDPKDFEHQRN